MRARTAKTDIHATVAPAWNENKCIRLDLPVLVRIERKRL